MSYRINTISNFRREAKKLIKKYPSLKTELQHLGKQLIQNPIMGNSLGNNCYKIRIAITSKGKGKSGGARVITYFFVSNETIFLLSIYDKSDKENISDKELMELLKKIVE